MPILLLCLALLLGAVPAFAQASPDSLRAGTRVRLLLDDERYVAGPLLRAGADSVVLRARRSTQPPRSYSTAAVRTLDVSRGRNRGAWAAGLAGAGAVAGLVWAERDAPADRDGEEIVIMGVRRTAYLITGVLYGALAGWLFAPERWRSMDPGR